MNITMQFLLSFIDEVCVNHTIYQVMHTYKGNKGANKALIAAEYAGVKIEESADFQMGVTNKSPEFLKMNPIGKVWNLFREVLFDVCCKFLANKRL